ncbi:hypothetical protein PROFUN_08183 [Planoprotostelium fungivorum]|uniref:Uncharacterized protein n=1 Tax=Planoprotostelium fungivorum TaxID=1890364 RepID=A0A2P6N636_9EUKA|nr:hypothetical protein PROFUN_08183 [Planoprotostelium fungivorum]
MCTSQTISAALHRSSGVEGSDRFVMKSWRRDRVEAVSVWGQAPQGESMPINSPAEVYLYENDGGTASLLPWDGHSLGDNAMTCQGAGKGAPWLHYYW